MPHTPAESHPFITYRFRDLVACLVVLAIGAAVMFTVKTAGTDHSIRLAGQAFLIGGVLLCIAYGGGAIVDRITRRMTFLTRSRNSPMFLILLALIGVAGLIFGYMQSPGWYREVLRPLLG